MRRSPNATTRLRRQSAQSVSLFPFLAVLICTMGALIVLLVVIAQQARLQASRDAIAAAEGDVAQLHEDLQDGLEMAELMVSQLAESCRRTEAELADARFQLGHVEQHALHLRARLPQLQATLAELEKAPGGDQLEQLGLELEAVQEQIVQARRRLDNGPPDQTAAKPASYAIIPYEGAHGTNRRPIYIECLAQAIIIQPEGIRLTEADFIGPTGPGNPLDVALRATREYLAASQDEAASGRQWEPYPLLLVRPSGIMAYYAAREAMASWGSEIGYELIEEDWPLVFPKADPALAAEVEQAVAIARRRMRQVAAVVSSRHGQSSQRRFAVSSNRGGLVPLGRSNGSTQEGFASNHASDPFGRRFAPPATDSGHTPVVPGPTSAASPAPVAAGRNNGATAPAAATVAAARTRRADAVSAARVSPATLEATPGRDSSIPTTNHAAPSLTADGSAAQYPDTATRRPGEGIRSFRQMVEGLGAGRTQGPVASGSTPGDSTASSVFGPTSKAASGEALADTNANPRSQARTAGSVAAPSSVVAPNSDGSPGGREPTGEHANSAAQASSCASLARIRGRNWGLSDQASDSIPLSRPIRVECYADRLVVVPDEGTTGGQIVALKDRTEDTIDTFVSALWDHMIDWKNAGQGMHWRPTLNVYVADDARNRFADLNVLLEGSGLTVKYAGMLRAESWRTTSRPERER